MIPSEQETILNTTFPPAIAVQALNLVYNGDFLYFSNRIDPAIDMDFGHPDGWVYSDPRAGAKIGTSFTTFGCVILTGSGNGEMTLTQALHELPRWRSMLLGKTVSAVVRLTVGASCEVALSLSDGVSETRRSLITTTTPLTAEVGLQLPVDAAATGLFLSIRTSSPSVRLELHQAFANTGDTAVEYAPCAVQGVIGERRQYLATEYAPAEEISLCQPAAELPADRSRLGSVLNGRFGRGANERSMLPDMRGYFSRSWNNGADVDPDAGQRQAWSGSSTTGDHVATLEPDMFAQHDHAYSTFVSPPPPCQSGPGALSITAKQARTEPAGGNETRPKNIAELYTIKWA
ncbi:MAG: hypothetical protein R3B70_03895 [Polyangiaceae bacterium]